MRRRVYYETGRLEECQEKLDLWEGHELFTTEVFREIVLRDLIVPYYQVKGFLATYTIFINKDDLSEEELFEKEMEVAEGLEEFMTLCDENGYKKTELATLLQLQSEYPPSSEYVRTLVFTKLQELYKELFDEQNYTYASLIDSTVLDAKTVMEDKVLYEKRVARRRRYTVFFSAVMVLIITAFVVIISNSRVDGLTKLLNRKSFNHELNRIKRRKNLYGIIMIDSDVLKQADENLYISKANGKNRITS